MPGIAFNQIPAALRLPGSYIEFDASLAGNAQQPFKRLMIGQRFSTGTIAANIPTRVTNLSQAEAMFGRGSMLASMLNKALAVDPWMETWAIALDDLVAGVEAAGAITFGGNALKAGLLHLYIGGRHIPIAVGSVATSVSLASDVATAINADTSLAVTAVAALGVVTLTARHKGLVGNDLDIRFNYYAESMPDGITATIAPMAGGAGNPDVSTAIAAMGSDWYRWIALPYTDVSNIGLFETELNDRYSALRQMGARAFGAYNGTHTAALALGAARNNPHVSIMGSQNSPTPSYEIAAIYCAQASKHLAIDPARPLQTLPLIGMLAPAIQDKWTDMERNLALWDAVSTYKVQPDGTCSIEAAITQYQTNAAGVDDSAYLYINTPETLETHRYNVRSKIGLLYPRHKLAMDSTPLPPGAAIARPKDIAATLRGVYQQEIDDGLMEDFAGYAATLFVEIDAANPNRVNVVDHPNLVNQLRVFANLVQFKV